MKRHSLTITSEGDKNWTECGFWSYVVFWTSWNGSSLNRIINLDIYARSFYKLPAVKSIFPFWPVQTLVFPRKPLTPVESAKIPLKMWWEKNMKFWFLPKVCVGKATSLNHSWCKLLLSELHLWPRHSMNYPVIQSRIVPQTLTSVEESKNVIQLFLRHSKHLFFPSTELWSLQFKSSLSTAQSVEILQSHFALTFILPGKSSTSVGSEKYLWRYD